MTVQSTWALQRYLEAREHVPTSLAELYAQAGPLERLKLLQELRAKLEVETGQRSLRRGEPAY